MNPARLTPCVRAALKPALVALLALLVVWLAVFAAGSAVHAATHADGGSHQCAICHFTKGHVLSADLAPMLAAIALVFTALAFAPLQVSLQSVDLRLAPSRAPPVSSRTSLR